MSPVSAQITPRLIENSWSFYLHMGVEECQTTPESGYLINPKRHPIPGSFRALIPDSRIWFWIPVEVVPTPTENIVLNSYLTKITILIAILPCNLARFCGHLFLAHRAGGFLKETGCKCPWLPAITLTSENLGFGGFYLVFEGLGIILVCG